MVNRWDWIKILANKVDKESAFSLLVLVIIAIPICTAIRSISTCWRDIYVSLLIIFIFGMIGLMSEVLIKRFAIN